MKATLFISILIFMSSSLFAQDISGNWKGYIDVNGNQLPIIFHFNKDSSGKVVGKWDSPKEKAMGLPISSVKIEKDSILLDIKMISVLYRGKFINNDSISGKWNQSQQDLPSNFHRSTESEQEVKQEVSPVVVYPNEKEISITSGLRTKLYGTLLSKNNQQKLAIIIAGSGPTDRNGNSALGAPTNEYQMLAHSLDSQNIATFRYDKFAAGKSIAPGFKESDIVFDNFVQDAENIFDYLHDTLGFKNIYFIGHSEGSLVGMLASEKKKAKGFISVAGAGRPINEILEEQLLQGPFPDSVKQQIALILNQFKNGKTVDDYPGSLANLFRKSVQPYLISWIKYSPQNEIAKLKCPILILQGSCDIQMKPEDASNLHNANKKSTLDIIPGMSHTLKNAGKDCVDENKTYTDGSMPIDQKLMEDIVKFIRK